MPKEILTLSFGSYASFVSAHYWNLQDECAGYASREEWSEYAASLDHDVLYMAHEERGGSLGYRPRAALFDIAGSSGGVSFSPDGTRLLAGPAAAAATWQGQCEVHRAPPVQRSAFTEQLEEHEELDWEAMSHDEAARQQAALEAAARQLDAGGVRHWTDYCKVVLHPRSVCRLPGTWTSVYEHSLSGGWGAGNDLLAGGRGAELLEEAAETVRFLGEACDSLAGFQVLVDDVTGFGAFAAAVLTEVADDYSGRPTVLFSLRPPPGDASAGQAGAGGSARASYDLSVGLATARLMELATLCIPLTCPAAASALPHLSYSPALPFHTSAILAAALHAALLPTRLTGAQSPLGAPLGATDLHSLARLLRPGGIGDRSGGAGLAALHLALPCPSLPPSSDLARRLDERVPHPPPHASARQEAAGAAAGGAVAAAGGQAQAGAGAGPGRPAEGGEPVPLLLHELASLTPGISGRDDPARGPASYAESYCVSGGRTHAGPASTSAALQSLDALLLQQPHRRSVRHRCAAPLPLAVPLPYPSIFARHVSVHGDVARTPVRKPGDAVLTAPLLSRLQATTEFQPWLRDVQAQWSRAASGVAGRAVLDAWDMERGSADEVKERLGELAASYDDADD